MPKELDFLRINKQQQVQKQADNSSIICTLNRNMFEQIIQSKNKDKTYNEEDLVIQNEHIFVPKNLLKIEPKQINSISWPQIFMPDADLYISLKGNFYLIKDNRNKKKYINRNAKPNSEIVYFTAIKINQKMTNLISVSKFIKINNQKKLQLQYCIDLVIFDSLNDSFQQYSINQKGIIKIKQTQYGLQFKSIQFISKYTKAVLIFEILNLNNPQYQIYLFDVIKQCKQQKSQKQIKIQKYQSKILATLAYNPGQDQEFIKMINSQYGDNVLFITTSDIFQIQIIHQLNNTYKIKLKAFLLSKIFQENTNTYLSSKKLMQSNNYKLQYKESLKRCQQIIDIQYAPNTLNLQILTNHGRIFQLQSQVYKLAQSLYEILQQNHLKDYYNVQNFIFNKLYSLKDLIVIYIQSDNKSQSGLLKNMKHTNQWTILDKQQQELTHQNVNRGLLLIRKQQHTFVFYKFVPLFFSIKQYEHFIIHPNKYSLQILIQTINKQNLDTLQLHSCQILSSKNSFVPFQKFHYIKDQHINLNFSSIQKKQINKYTAPMIYFQKTSKSFLILQDNLIHGYKMFTNQLDNTFLYGIKKTFSIQTFQKPNKLIIHPLTNIIVVLFKQFIKFYHNNYSELRNYHILNSRNVSDINFSKNGEYIILSHNDNNIYLIDFYRFNQKKIISFYSDIKQVHYITQKIISIKSIKNHLNIFKKKQKINDIVSPKQQIIQQYEKVYQIQVASGDLYYINEEITLIVKKNGKIQVFSHNIIQGVLDNQNINEQIYNLKQKKHHQYLINRKQIKYQNGQYPTSILFSQQLLILFIGTNYGNLIQIVYPFFSIDHQNYLICYKLSLTNSMIVHLQMSATFNSMVIISEKLQIIQVQFIQYINGLKMNGIYKTVLSDKLNSNLLKYQYANRNYLHQKLFIIGQTIKNNIRQNFDEYSFINDKLKDDLQDMMNKIKYQSAKNINNLSQKHKKLDDMFKQEFQQISEKFTIQNQLINQQINNQLLTHKKLIQQEKQIYQKQILQIYKQYDRLQALKKSSLNQYQQKINLIRQQFIQTINKQTQIRRQQIQTLQNNYKKVADKYYLYKNTASQQRRQNQQQLNKIKNIEINKLQNQLKQQELKKQKYLSYFNKTERQIEKYRNRTNSFQNLIVEAKHQISQLINENRQYNDKRTFLFTQLNDKQQIIQDKQSQIILFMKNNSQIIKQKNIHQFQLQQNQKNLIPIKRNIQKLQQKMQKMNKQIQDQYLDKISNIKNIQQTKKNIQKLKQKHQKTLQLNVLTKIKYYRFQKQLAFLTQNYNDTQIKQKIYKILNIFSKNQQKNNVKNKQSIQIYKKEGEKLIRKKNMLIKQIQKQQRGQNGILRNKHQFVKYYVENTKIVKQYNQLSQEHGILLLGKKKLEEKIKKLKEQIFNTPIKRSQSMYIAKKSQIKLTPFQKYQQGHFGQMMKSKIHQSMQTKASKQDSSKFLKSLIKDVGSTDNQYTKSVLVRDRIRTFINPQITKIKDLQKQLFQGNRNRGKSNFLKL